VNINSGGPVFSQSNLLKGAIIAILCFVGFFSEGFIEHYGFSHNSARTISTVLFGAIACILELILYFQEFEQPHKIIYTIFYLLGSIVILFILYLIADKFEYHPGRGFAQLYLFVTVIMVLANAFVIDWLLKFRNKNRRREYK